MGFDGLFCSPLHAHKGATGGVDAGRGGAVGRRSTTYVMGMLMTGVRQRWRRAEDCTQRLEGLQMGMGGMAAKGPLDGWREGGCTDKKSQWSDGRCRGVQAGRRRAVRGHSMQSARQGGRGRDRDTTGCIPLHFVPCAPPLRRHWWPGGKKVWEWALAWAWVWVCCAERGTKAEPLLLLLLHGKTAAGLPLLPLPALPLAIDLVWCSPSGSWVPVQNGPSPPLISLPMRL